MTKLGCEDVLMCNPSGFQFRPNFDILTKIQCIALHCNGLFHWHQCHESKVRLSNDNKHCHNFVKVAKYFCLHRKMYLYRLE